MFNCVLHTPLNVVTTEKVGFKRRHLVQKQPPEVFCKKRCSQKFHKIPRKITVPESQRLQYRCFPVNFKKFLRTFHRTLPDDCFYTKFILSNDLNSFVKLVTKFERQVNKPIIIPHKALYQALNFWMVPQIPLIADTSLGLNEKNKGRFKQPQFQMS